MISISSQDSIEKSISASFESIAPFWPLKSFISVNPLKGFENLAFEEAIKASYAYGTFQSKVPQLAEINRLNVKWLQAFSDQGQATISMPLRDLGFYASWRELIVFDEKFHQHNGIWIESLKTLPEKSWQAVEKALEILKISPAQYSDFLTLILQTLPGWSAYVASQAQWTPFSNGKMERSDFLAVRLTLFCFLWPQASDLMFLYQKELQETDCRVFKNLLIKVEEKEKIYEKDLIKGLARRSFTPCALSPLVQMVFCIDPRSEPMRYELEKRGPYETFGFSGFFGLPIFVKDEESQETYRACPALLTPQHEVKMKSCCENSRQPSKVWSLFQRCYPALKDTFGAPFVLAELMGIWSGFWMILRTFFPQMAFGLYRRISGKRKNKPEISFQDISLENRCLYGKNVLRMMGLVDRWAPWVVFCGHGGSSQNNAYASALDCGACGGNSGAINARVLAAILNDSCVRKNLALDGIQIPQTTQFLAAQHHTTTDEIEIFDLPESEDLKKFSQVLQDVQKINVTKRLEKLQETSKIPLKAMQNVDQRSKDWSQTRPEWGLAGNAAFILGPRALSKNFSLEGRCFLHSYEESLDPDGVLLEGILTAPVVVAQWINAQYFFSTLSQDLYGAGSKITQNITGKFAPMQGNASDLMTGLPLQSIGFQEGKAYHPLQRLLIVIAANPQHILRIVMQHTSLKNWVAGKWVKMISYQNGKYSRLKDQGTWEDFDPSTFDSSSPKGLAAKK